MATDVRLLAATGGVTRRARRIDWVMLVCSVFIAIVVVIDRAHPDQGVSTLHVAYAPSLQVRAGDEVTFKARAFGTTDGEETWDFGDGSPKATTHSNRHTEQHAKDGYAVITHRYPRPGDYLIRVERTDAQGRVAIGRVHVPVNGK